jgi:NADP-dependent 3-hydroxy acid dehydrogenase YdfG
MTDILGGIYCATKHAVNAFNGVLLRELVNTPIRVCEIQPGKPSVHKPYMTANVVRYGRDRILGRPIPRRQVCRR